MLGTATHTEPDVAIQRGTHRLRTPSLSHHATHTIFTFHAASEHPGQGPWHDPSGFALRVIASFGPHLALSSARAPTARAWSSEPFSTQTCRHARNPSIPVRPTPALIPSKKSGSPIVAAAPACAAAPAIPPAAPLPRAPRRSLLGCHHAQSHPHLSVSCVTFFSSSSVSNQMPARQARLHAISDDCHRPHGCSHRNNSPAQQTARVRAARRIRG